jgi:hypothetical protein
MDDEKILFGFEWCHTEVTKRPVGKKCKRKKYIQKNTEKKVKKITSHYRHKI